MTRAIRVIVRGRVHGVGFRAGVAGEAVRLGLAGWVRNRRDGTVEALLEGAAERVAEIAAWMEHGPAHARVDGAEVVEMGVEGLVEFEVRGTV